MDKREKLISFLDKVTKALEISIAFLLLIVITIKLLDMIFEITNFQIILLNIEFKQILSIAFNLVIGVEFTRMLYRHTPETVVYVLLFAIARLMILHSEDVLHLLVGVLAIAGLFAARKYLIGKPKE